MYNPASARRRKKNDERLNLVPILDAVFIIIFFLLLSANFIKIFEIGSDLPIVSTEKVEKNKKKPLNLTIKVERNRVDIFTGEPQKLSRKIANQKGQVDFTTLHQYLLGLKRKFQHEKVAIIEPSSKVSYEQIVMVLDATRQLKQETNDLKELFPDVIFGNLIE